MAPADTGTQTKKSKKITVALKGSINPRKTSSGRRVKTPIRRRVSPDDMVIQDEAEYEGEIQGKLTLKKHKFTGDLPPYEHPDTLLFDDEGNKIYIYVYHETKRGWQLYKCDMGTFKWENLTPRFRKLHIPSSPLTRADEVALPSHQGSTSSLFKFDNQRCMLMFGGQDNTKGPTSSDFILFNLDNYRWWKVDMLEGNALPRTLASSRVIKNRFYVFGGQRLDLLGRPQPMESYSIAEFDPTNHRWSWIVCDRAYPVHVPPLGWCCDARVMQDGRKILLTPGVVNNTRKVQVNLSPSSFVWYDVARDMFEVQGQMAGNFPDAVPFYNIASLPQLEQHAYICTWDASLDFPELWQYSFEPDEQKICPLGLRQQLKSSLRTPVYNFFAVKGRLFLLGAQSTSKTREFTVCVEVGLGN